MEIENIDGLIRVVRGRRVMLDEDLAQLYGVETKRLNEAVRRNADRFPDDFMIQMSRAETLVLRSQTATLKIKGSGRGRKYWPLAFTEQGVAMLSGVLNSDRAVQANIAIMRAFVRFRRALALSQDLAQRLRKVEKRLEEHGEALGEHAAALRSVFEDIRGLMGPPDGPRRRIGF